MSIPKIAIIGVACRFPGSVTNLDEFWRLLRDERDVVTEIAADRFGTDYYLHPSPSAAGKSYSFAAGVLDDIAGFDANFFSISPREATQMDPQQRMLIQLAWEAFEDADLQPAQMRGKRCSVYVGAETPDYGMRQIDDACATDPYSSTGTTLSILSNRISYLYDLRGPSLTLNTACSSSLVALHQAVEDLRTGIADYALVGGVNLISHPGNFIGLSKTSMLSKQGRCRAFDAAGDGYVRAEGAALVLLTTLDRALSSPSQIHAVIAGSGVSSNGYSPGSMTEPSVTAQSALIRDVYTSAEVNPDALSYFETHSVGSPIGDPVEAQAVAAAVTTNRAENDPLLIGSVKTNIGHLETASGLASLLKAILCLKHRAVPRSLHFETPHPGIDFKNLRLKVVDGLTQLVARSDQGLIVGVNSFGLTGANAHVLLAQAPVSFQKDNCITPAACVCNDTTAAKGTVNTSTELAVPEFVQETQETQ
jgi:acyl transferase domain-containing protein